MLDMMGILFCALGCGVSPEIFIRVYQFLRIKSPKVRFLLTFAFLGSQAGSKLSFNHIYQRVLVRAFQYCSAHSSDSKICCGVKICFLSNWCQN